ncbi:hypothetical protein FBUS_11649 [Fasciolopsis buskii]|uniref:Uncharacterized protein n=1 Tax=Fasciolopsis buskii TaxID=27845 RepID=A0A8E0VPC7_9TREM|nr:hypothetical protein FBUS_11649 [Fasciolopsis buski]
MEVDGQWTEDVHGMTGLLGAISQNSADNGEQSASAEERLKLAIEAVSKWAAESPAWATVQELARAVSSGEFPLKKGFCLSFLIYYTTFGSCLMNIKAFPALVRLRDGCLLPQ